MQLVKIKKKTNSKVEQAKTVLSVFCLLMNIKLSDTELTVLAYLMVYRINRRTKDLILNAGVMKNDDSLKSTLSRLKKFGMIVKDPITKQVHLREELNFSINDSMGVLIKVDCP